jgi:hypothetical protein
MTTAPRILSTPRLEARAFAVGLTARSSQVEALRDLACDAASGHPSQRMTLPRITSTSIYHTYWSPTAVPRWLRVEALFTSSSVTSINGVSLKLGITDDLGGAVVYTDPEIPDGLDGSVNFVSGYTTANPSRLGAGNRQTWLLDIDALVAAGLSLAAGSWRFAWTPTVTSPGEIECLAVDEVPRFAVDDAETFGQIPGVYLPRGLVKAGSPLGLQRLWATVRVGLVSGLRTYHSMARAENDPWLVTATSLASFGGSDEESAGVPMSYRVRPRAMRAGVDTPVKFLIRYKITAAVGGDTATVRLTTGAGAYDVVLTDVSAAWAESTWTTAALDAAATDTLTWTAKVSNGASTLHVIARPVVDAPTA